MRVSQIKQLSALSAATALTLIILLCRVCPVLQYFEGWTTFYYDKHFITSELSNGNISSLISAFFLQFFHAPVHGILVMTILFTIVAALLFILCRKIKNSILACAIPFLLTSMLAFTSVSALSKTSVMGILGMDGGAFSQNRLYMQYSNLSYAEDWDGIISLWQENKPETNFLNQNIINMAMAEKGMLHEHLTDNPCIDINSIYVSHIEGEHVAAMLSDVYYSMGHIAQAQRYAFEANEKMRNNSPRLLQRLIKTNIIYGQYGVARKYIKKLSSACYYKSWCERYLKLTDAKATMSDKEMKIKSLCLNIDNKFSGFGGLDKDLLQVARATRGTRQSNVTVQYLSALFRLAGYREPYIQLLNEYKLKEL